MQYVQYVLIAVFVVLFVALTLRSVKRNREIRQGGIEAEAEVTRITEEDSYDADGSYSGTEYHYYVTYQAMNGQTVEARLGSGKNVDFRFGKKAWDRDLREGSKVRVRYLPEKPEYVVLVTE